MEQGEFRQLTADLAELAVNAGLVNSVIGHYPEEVQNNWDEKLAEIRRWANNEILEIQSFAEAFD